MSDNWVIIVPKIPEHVPSSEQVHAALALMKETMANADEIEIVQKEHVQFFDCGANLETIICPRCGTAIALDWWGKTMSADFDDKTGFRLDSHPLPCCSASVSLNELAYDFHQAFGRFALCAMNPNSGEMSDDAVGKIEAVLGCKVSVVYQHI